MSTSLPINASSILTATSSFFYETRIENRVTRVFANIRVQSFLMCLSASSISVMSTWRRRAVIPISFSILSIILSFSRMRSSLLRATRRRKIRFKKERMMRRKLLHNWFGNGSDKIGKRRPTTRGAPDLHEHDLLTAYRVRLTSLAWISWSGPKPLSPRSLPGYIVHQSPPPGTIMQKGSSIEVVLSRAP